MYTFTKILIVLNIILCVIFEIYSFKLTLKDKKLKRKRLNGLKRDVFPLTAFWNLKTAQCIQHSYEFESLLDTYNIVHNSDDTFQGEFINIMYNPGDWPILTSGVPTNGGVPQAGNITKHLEDFEDDVDTFITDPDNLGLGIIDFENWRPIYRQNSANYMPYQTYSENIEWANHPGWTSTQIKAEAQANFEAGARVFMEDTIDRARVLRPDVLWGYYHYPFCHATGSVTSCSSQVQGENDSLEWLFDACDVLYPSVYVPESYTRAQQVQFVKNNVDEAIRVRDEISPGTLIVPYVMCKYKDTFNFMTEGDMNATIATLASYDIDAMVIWGRNADSNTATTCADFYNYVDTVLGPILAQFY